MSMYNGNEFNSEKGTHGSLLKFIWSKIYGKFVDVQQSITTALSNYYTKSEVDTKEAALQQAITTEAASRQTAISTLQSTLQTAIDSKTTTAEVATQITTAIDALVNGAPAALDTLKEISDALAVNKDGDDATLNALNALITTVGGKASQESVDALALRVTTAEGEIDGIQAAKADVTYVDTKVVELQARDNSLLNAIVKLLDHMFIPVRSLLSMLPVEGQFHVISAADGANTKQTVILQSQLGLILNVGYLNQGTDLEGMTDFSSVTWNSIDNQSFGPLSRANSKEQLDAIVVRTSAGLGIILNPEISIQPNEVIVTAFIVAKSDLIESEITF